MSAFTGIGTGLAGPVLARPLLSRQNKISFLQKQVTNRSTSVTFILVRLQYYQNLSTAHALNYRVLRANLPRAAE